MEELTQEYLYLNLKYCPETGEFMWKLPKQGRRLGANIGCPCPKGYVQIVINGIPHRAHRLAFLYMTGCIPEEVDHINGNTSDNRWSNLRASTGLANSQNQKKAKNYYFNKQLQKYVVELKMLDKTLYIGAYEDEEYAKLVAQEARLEFFGEQF